MRKKPKKIFYTVSRGNVKDVRSAFFDKDYIFSEKENADNVLIEGVVDISCSNPDCKTSFRTRKDNAAELLETVRQKGCPICGKKEFVISRVKSL